MTGVCIGVRPIRALSTGAQMPEKKRPPRPHGQADRSAVWAISSRCSTTNCRRAAILANSVTTISLSVRTTRHKRPSRVQASLESDPFASTQEIDAAVPGVPPCHLNTL